MSEWIDSAITWWVKAAILGVAGYLALSLAVGVMLGRMFRRQRPRDEHETEAIGGMVVPPDHPWPHLPDAWHQPRVKRERGAGWGID